MSLGARTQYLQNKCITAQMTAETRIALKPLQYRRLPELLRNGDAL